MKIFFGLVHWQLCASCCTNHQNDMKAFVRNVEKKLTELPENHWCTQLDWYETKVPPPIFREFFFFLRVQLSWRERPVSRRLLGSERGTIATSTPDLRCLDSEARRRIRFLGLAFWCYFSGFVDEPPARPGPERSQRHVRSAPWSKELFRGLFVSALQDGTSSCLNVGQNECLSRFLHIPLWLSIRASMIASRITFWEKEIRQRKDRLLNFHNAKPSLFFFKRNRVYTRHSYAYPCGSFAQNFFRFLVGRKKVRTKPIRRRPTLHGRDQSAMKDAKLVKRFSWTTRFRGRGPHEKMKEVFSSNERRTTRSASPGHGFVQSDIDRRNVSDDGNGATLSWFCTWIFRCWCCPECTNSSWRSICSFSTSFQTREVPRFQRKQMPRCDVTVASNKPAGNA